MGSSETPAFSPERAAMTLAEVAGYEAGLRRRTEGITWMVWAMASPAIFLTYAFFGVIFDVAGEPWPWWAGLGFAPWVALGVLTTAAVWRSAALAAGLKLDAPRGPLVGVAWAAAMIAAGLVALFVVGRLRLMNEPLYFLLAVGAAWALFGAVNLYRCTAIGQRVSIAIGASCVLTALLAAPFIHPTSDMGYFQATVVASVASAVLPLFGGFYQTMRG